MSMLCLASGALVSQIAVGAFTLAWMHSIEKIRWEEDWRTEGAELVLIEGRVRGSGAGMEPPAGAKLIDGVWHYPGKLRVTELNLAHSPFTTGYDLCSNGKCQPLAVHLRGLPEIANIRLSACP